MPFEIENPAVADHRGNRRRLLAAEPGFFSLPTNDRPDLFDVARPLWTPVSRVLITAVCIAIFVFIAPLVLTGSNTNITSAILLAAAAASTVIVLVYATLTRALRDTDAERIVEALMAQNRCPSCFFDLSNTAAESDACKVCPECGGAWRSTTKPDAIDSD